jgi:hypothetical protein
MTIELDDNESRLVFNVLIEQAQEHSSYADSSEVARKIYQVAARFGNLRVGENMQVHD